MHSAPRTKNVQSSLFTSFLFFINSPHTHSRTSQDANHTPLFLPIGKSRGIRCTSPFSLVSQKGVELDFVHDFYVIFVDFCCLTTDRKALGALFIVDLQLRLIKSKTNRFRKAGVRVEEKTTEQNRHGGLRMDFPSTKAFMHLFRSLWSGLLVVDPVCTKQRESFRIEQFLRLFLMSHAVENRLWIKTWSDRREVFVHQAV